MGWTPRDYKTLLLTVGAVALLLLVTIMTLKVAQLEVHNHVTVGMTREDVLSRLGTPDRVVEQGESFDKSADGSVPTAPNDNGVYIYVWRAQLVYVYFDARDRVAVYYVIQP